MSCPITSTTAPRPPLARAALLTLWLCVGLLGTNAAPPAIWARSAVPAAGTYAPFPTPDAGYVTDLAGLLSGDQQERIEQWLRRTEQETRVEMCVVTIPSMADYPGTPNQSIERFATALFDRWGIGNRPANDGVLLLVSVQDRKARIELGAGYGRGRDAAAQRIMQDLIVPRFRDSDYPGGIDAGVRALMLEFARVRVGWNWGLIASFAAIPIAGLTAFSLFRNGRRGWGWVFVGLTIVLILVVVRMVFGVIRHLGEGRSSSWSAGGIGGFGGGSSGGGGATGSW